MAKYDLSYTVEDGFEVLLSNLRLSADERNTVTSRQFEIEAYLAQYIDRFITVLPDAFTRHTMIAPLKRNVIDMLFLLRQEHSSKYQPAELVEKLYMTFEPEYPIVEKSWDGRGVIVGFPECTFKVMPGFTLDKGGYLIPEFSGAFWIEYNPDRFKDMLEQADRESDGRLVPVIKMLKCWNRTHEYIFHGYYLELLVMELMRGLKFNSYAGAIRHVLNKGKLKAVFRADDPSVTHRTLDGLKDVGLLVQGMLNFQNAYDIARVAMQYEEAKDIAPAYHEWEKIFPGFFPAPVSMVIEKLKQANIEGPEALKIIKDYMK